MSLEQSVLSVRKLHQWPRPHLSNVNILAQVQSFAAGKQTENIFAIFDQSITQQTDLNQLSHGTQLYKGFEGEKNCAQNQNIILARDWLCSFRWIIIIIITIIIIIIIIIISSTELQADGNKDKWSIGPLATLPYPPFFFFFLVPSQSLKQVRF